MKLIFLTLFTLSSCGYSAIYGERGESEKLEKIFVTSNFKNLKLAQKQVLQIISNNFSKEKTGSEYFLEINNISESENPVNLNNDGLISEYSYSLNISAKITDKNKKIILNKAFSENTNYRIDGNYYASQSAKKTLRKNLSQKIAEDIKSEFILAVQ
jgi:outer membrane lipopolysaccharide assembly protein LptE/RlpB